MPEWNFLKAGVIFRAEGFFRCQTLLFLTHYALVKSSLVGFD
jgi:hypothetical protein